MRQYSCPVELVFSTLAGKWKVVLLARLKERPHRYAELRASLPRISDKMLTQRLQELVADGLVTQNKSGGRGAPSTYQLTERGLELGPALKAFYSWGLAEAARTGVLFES